MPELRQRGAEEEDVIFRFFKWLQVQIIRRLGIRVHRLFILKLLFLLLTVCHGPR
jgi:hypothetical protein